MCLGALDIPPNMRILSVQHMVNIKQTLNSINFSYRMVWLCNESNSEHKGESNIMTPSGKKELTRFTSIQLSAYFFKTKVGFFYGHNVTNMCTGIYKGIK